MDLLPTFAHLAGGQVPGDRKIDGKNIWSILSGESDARSPHVFFYYYKATQLRAVRSGKWKLHLPVNTNAWRPGMTPRFEKTMLFDLKNDPGEKNNLAAEHPDIVFLARVVLEIEEHCFLETRSHTRTPGIRIDR